MFIHHVYFWLKNTGNVAEYEQLRVGLKLLSSIQPHVLAHIGVPAGTNRSVIDSSYTFSLLMIFNTSDDEAKYQSHPTHDSFRKNYSHLWSKVMVYDSIDG